MKIQAPATVTPQSKIIGVNDRFGNPGLKKQQGSTIEIYDFEKLDFSKTVYEFFINAKNKQFPFTNLTDGKLQPQESFAMERMYFAIVDIDDATGSVLVVSPLTIGGYPTYFLSEVEFQIENQRVLKPLPLRSFTPEFNPDTDNNLCTVFEFDTQIVIPPLLNFKATVKFQPGFYTPEAGTSRYLVCTIGGPGGIFAPKSNY